MKIRNKFFVPVIAVLMAIFMVGGSVSGSAADTSAPEETSDTSTTHPLTYIPTTYPPTSSLEEEIDAIVSNNFGSLGQYGDDVRETNNILNTLLNGFNNFIDMIINFIKTISDKLGGLSLG